MTEAKIQAPETMEAWCMRCQARRTVDNPKAKYIRGARGLRLQLQGRCPVCGGVVNRFMKTRGVNPPTPPAKEDKPAIDENRGPSGDSRATLHVVTYWCGFCQRCRAERQFTGELIGRRWDGKKVLNGKCLTCDMPQVVVGVEEYAEPENGDG